MLSAFVIGCVEPPTCEPLKFKNGEIVESVVGNHTGQIVKVIYYNHNCKRFYDVRFNIKSNKTKTRLIGNDGDIESGLSLIEWMEEYELKKVTK